MGRKIFIPSTKKTGVVKKSLVLKCKDFSETLGSIMQQWAEAIFNHSFDTLTAANHR